MSPGEILDLLEGWRRELIEKHGREHGEEIVLRAMREIVRLREEAGAIPAETENR